MAVWEVLRDALGWIQWIGGGLFLLGAWLVRERLRKMRDEATLLTSLTGGRSIKTQLEDLGSRVTSLEHRIDHGTTKLSDLTDDVQKLIGEVAVSRAQIEALDGLTRWLRDAQTARRR